MKVNRHNLKSKLGIIISLFMLITAVGVLFVIRTLSVSFTIRQLVDLTIVICCWGLTLTFIYKYFLSHIYRPIDIIRQAIGAASAGELTANIDVCCCDEIGSIASAINDLSNNQERLALELEKIGEGDFSEGFPSDGEKNKLGMAVAAMKSKLHKIVSDDATRQWSSEGLARYSTLLRENCDDLNILCDKLLPDLVKYMNANQGAIFLVKDEDGNSFLELTSAYAWQRKKHITGRINIGEGLIGQAAIEKETVFITDVPENFIKITSGLGEANPRSIILVPMLFSNELFGVIEFASFHVFKPFEREFLERLAEIVASTISRTNINKKTENLLRDSQKLTEELRIQKEEMHRNLEEMNATQEEMQQREVERIGIFTAINNTLATVEFNMDGRIIIANEMFLKMMNYTIEEIENKTDRLFADKSNEPIELYNKFWSDLNKCQVRIGDFRRLTRDGRELWLSASYTPALDKKGKPYKVIMLAQDISEKKKAELELHRQAGELRAQGDKLLKYTAELEDIKQNLSEKLNEASKGLIKKIKDIETEKEKNIAVLEGCVDGVISFGQDGKIVYFNHSAEEIWGIQRENVLGKQVSSIIPLDIKTKDGKLTAYYSANGTGKEIQVRTEISLSHSNGNTIDLLVTLTRAKVENEFTFTIFAQNISVDFF
ncbi:MAG: PAS domain S-box protein [Methanosarcina sp.]